MNPNYTYICTLNRVVDGDTVIVDIDLGFGVWLKGQVLRLAGINTPETRGPERPQGLDSKRFVASTLKSARGMVITTQVSPNKGKYGRWLASIHYLSGMGWINLNNEIVALGYGEVKYYD